MCSLILFNPIFFSRTTSKLFKRVCIIISTGISTIYANTYYTDNYNQYDLECYKYYHPNVKAYKKTHDSRYLITMNLRKEDFDPVTKLCKLSQDIVNFDDAEVKSAKITK